MFLILMLAYLGGSVTIPALLRFYFSNTLAIILFATFALIILVITAVEAVIVSPLFKSIKLHESQCLTDFDWFLRFLGSLITKATLILNFELLSLS